MNMAETLLQPQITEPREPQDFGKPVTIRWGPMDKDVLSWWLCVGTVQPDVDEGDWNILNEDMGQRTETTISVRDSWKISGIRIQLLCTIPDKSLNPPERTMVLEPIVINSINAKAS